MKRAATPEADPAMQRAGERPDLMETGGHRAPFLEKRKLFPFLVLRRMEIDFCSPF